MTNILKYDVVIVKFPFASSLKYKARPAVIVSSNDYNANKRDTLLILAISSGFENKLKYLFIKNPNYQKPKEITNARQKFAGATSSFKGF